MKRLQQHRASSNRCSHRRGSILLLIVVVLVLLALLGTAYVQITQVDRIATRQVGSNNIDQVVKATIGAVQSRLAQDIFDDAGLLFNPDTAAAGAGDESFDYPSTNAGVLWDPPVTYADGSPAAAGDEATGGKLDDTHLASSFLTQQATPDRATWGHITNFNGIFLRIPKVGSGTLVPVEDIVSNADLATENARGFFKRDTWLNVGGSTTWNLTDDAPDDGAETHPGTTGNYDPIGADADGDTLPDSRYTWAPIRQIGPTAYVMALRIIDASAMAPINGATAMTSDGDTGGASPSGQDFRGYVSTSLDLTRLLKRANTAWSTELDSVLTTRGLTTAKPQLWGIQSPLSTYATGNYYTNFLKGTPTVNAGQLKGWLDQARVYGTTTNNYPVADMLELLNGWGLNNGGLTTSLESDMPNTLRAEIAGDAADNDGDTAVDEVEAKYDDIVGGTTALDMIEWTQGDTATALDLRADIPMRKWVTTVSGAADFASNFPNGTTGIHAGVRTLRYDLTWEDGGADDDASENNNTRATNIATRLQTIFSATPAYLSGEVTPTAPVPAPTATVLATEYGVAIQDYSDADNVPSALSTGGVTYYGMELMPFLREVYVQMAYDDTDSDSDTQFDQWVPKADSTALIVELGNPFDRTLTAADHLNGRIQIVVNGTAWTVAGATDMTRNDSTNTNDVLVFHQNPMTPGEEPTGTSRVTVATDVGVVAGVPKVAIPAGTFSLTAGTQVTVELRVDVGGGSFVTYDRLTISTLTFPAMENHTAAAVAMPVHAQGSVARAGEGRQYISNTGKALVNSMRKPDLLGYRNDSSTEPAEDALGDDTKGAIVGDASLDATQVLIANRPIFSVAEIGWISMIGFTDEANTGDFATRISGDDGSYGTGAIVSSVNERSKRMFLNFDPAAGIVTATGMPHAAMAMDQFTTFSHINDGVDNDNDDGDDDTSTGADNDGEQMEAWKININTAPPHVLALCAPLPEAVADVASLMDLVVQYRDGSLNNPAHRTSAPFNYPAGWRTQPGIASIGELMFLKNTAGTNEMQKYFLDATDNAQQLDRFPLAEHSNVGSVTQSTTADGVIDEAEERMMRFQFLSSVFRTRSDVFIMYATIKGYPAQDFSQGVSEQARIIAIFNRGGMTTSNDEVQLIGLVVQ